MGAGGHQHKSQEHEGSDQTLSVFAFLVEANDHLATAKNFFGMLQHGNETLLGSLRKDVTGDLNEESLAKEERVPLDLQTDE